MTDKVKETILKSSIEYAPIRGVYILFDDKEVVYVGQSRDCNRRIPVHRKNKQFNRYTIIPLEWYVDANEAEASYIVMFKPKYNKQIEPNSRWMRKKDICKSLKITSLRATNHIKKNNISSVFGAFYDINDFKGINNA